MAGSYTLYGGQISYYSGKARAYLRYKGIPFEEVQATREVYKEIILPRVGWPVIPVVVTPEGETLQDTTDIIDALEHRFPDPSVYPTGPRQKLVALLLEVFGDEWLKIPAMHYRWNHNTDWIIGEFGRLSRPDGTPEEQREIGERTCRPFRGSLPALGVHDATIPAVEASYEGLLAELDAHFAEHRYLLGDSPCIGDFGLIGPLFAHQFADPASGALMRRLAPNVVAWVERMMAGGDDPDERRDADRRDAERRDADRRDADRRDADRRDAERREAERREAERRAEERPGVDRRLDDRRLDDRRSRERRSATAAFLPDDTVPITLMPVLARMVDEYFPVLAAELDAFEAWDAEHPGEEIPRAVGTHTFTLGRGTDVEAQGERALFTFDLWMFQRPQDHLAALEGAAREACRTFAEDLGALSLLERRVHPRLAREHFRLVRAA